MGDSPLEVRFADAVRSLGLSDGPGHLLVALSGGLDSIVLLHLLRFGSGEASYRLTAAHLDHRMRPSSAGDAAWVRGLCAAWGVPLEAAEARLPLRTEDAAREERYDFLREAAARTGADSVLTAHHADDQAETVLFRILRGTGIAGLAGIPAATRSGIVRPLLGFWRSELEEYAERQGLAWRTDPTNATLGPIRNRIRHQLLPLAEREISPGARRNLVALAGLARKAEAGWRSVVGAIFDQLVVAEGDAMLVARQKLRGYDPEIQKRLVRRLLRRFGVVPGRVGTHLALQFITDAPSGREFHLPDGVRIRTEFERARVERDRPVQRDEPVALDRPDRDAEVAGTFTLGGRRYRARLRAGGPPVGMEASSEGWSVWIPLDDARFPVTLRGREPGDRVRTSGGTKSLKKLMIERRIPVAERATIPVLVDGDGRLLWVAGLASAIGPVDPDTDALHLAIRDARGG